MLELRTPSPCGLFPLLASLLPLALSSMPTLRYRTMDAAATLVGRQVSLLSAGEPLPEAQAVAMASAASATAAADGHFAQLSQGMSSAWEALAQGKLPGAMPSPFAAAADETPGAPTPPPEVPSEAGGAADETATRREDALSVGAEADPLATCIGACVGFVVPRCSDPDARVRQRACAALLGLLQIGGEGRSRAAEGAEVARSAEAGSGSAARAEMQSCLAEVQLALSRCAEAAELEPRIACQRTLVPHLVRLLPSAGIDALVRSLVDGLEAEWSAAAAACVALDGLLPSASASSSFVRAVLGSLLAVLPRIENAMTRNGALAVGHSLAVSDLDAVMATLLEQPTPLGTAATQMAQRLAREPPMMAPMLRALSAAVADSSLPAAFVDKDAQAAAALAALKAATATALLASVAEEALAPLAEHRPALVAALVLRLGAVKGLGGRAEATAQQAAAAFLGTLDETATAATAAGTPTAGTAAAGTPTELGGLAPDFGGEVDSAAALMASAEPLEAEPLAHAALSAALDAGRIDGALAARSLVHVALRAGGCSARAVLSGLERHCAVPHDGQRQTIVGAIAELVREARDDAALAQQGLQALLGRLGDASAVVRTSALYGIRQLGEAGAFKAHLRAELPSILATLSTVLADGTPPVVLAAFAALTPALAAAPPSAIVLELPPLTEHSRAAAEHDNEPSASAADTDLGSRTRAAGFEVFAWLTRANGAQQTAEQRAAFAEHAQAVLPLLLLHADHPNPMLRRGALAALGALEPWHGKNLGRLAATPVAPGGGDAWLKPLCEALLRDQRARLARHCASYAKRVVGGADAHVRARAALLIGGYLRLQTDWATGTDGRQVHKQAIDQLVSALADPDKDVRREAAHAIGSLSGGAR